MPSVRKTVAVVAVLAAAGSTAGAAGRADVYAPPSPVPALSASTLDARYQATARDITRALGMARHFDDPERARALSALLAPGRRFLSFDARGAGRAVEVLGDLEHAERIAVVIPGADNSLSNFDSPKFVGGGSRALYRQARADAPRARIAVIAWLGYGSPSTRSTAVLTSGRAQHGARDLGRLLAGVHRMNAHARFALLCHSYGTVVCGKAARRLAPLPVDEIALFGSPGTGAGHAAGLGTPARVWAGRSKGDWMRYVPNVGFAGVGFGPDPVSRDFGALRFDAGTGPHSGYLKPGSLALRNLALIALGRDAEVTRV
ncbi:Alpha/beta hydrolase [Actinomadura madurae]|uniref:Alpha/beta hydrolase n=1 Tax=Actinomadura madurae TaxID=1993 RepID=A0A1I5VRJ5_9ACTN|nr:alpha/beta hydrolase [Actinomadura madurae]SFQ09626.1 Alpha/beta hydrolase [Actinomadura madurae]